MGKGGGGGVFASNSYRTRVGGFGRVGDLPAVRSFGVHQDGCHSAGLEQTKYQPGGGGGSFPRPNAAVETYGITQSTCPQHSNMQHPIH